MATLRDDGPAVAAAPRPPAGAADRWRLVLASGLMLFVELALIRWAGSNIVHLSYFSNFVLLGSFLGIGLGFLRSGHAFDLSRWWPVLLAALVVFVAAFPVQISQNSDQILYFTGVRPTGLPAWVTLPLLFLAVAAVMCGLGEGVARMFPAFVPLEAYRLDLAGSLAGIVAFTALSFLHAPPLAWGALTALGYVALRRGRPGWVAAASLALVVVVLGVETFGAGLSWSPYYKVKTTDRPNGAVDISVNGVPHQAINPAIVAVPGLRAAPYDRVERPAVGEVLVIGAGNGNDVAVALDRGASRVDAVDIDRRLVQIGRERHPARPYQDPRVHVHIDDGRAFLQRTSRSYDLIVFALPDSLTLVSGQSSLRLESYLFTQQAIDSARDHLRPGGVFAMYNSYRKDWLVDRYAGTLQAAFGHAPCVDSIGGAGHQAALVVARDAADQRCTSTWKPSGAVPAAATDDHPFPYLRERGIPSYYLIVLGLIWLVALLAVRTVGGPLRAMRPYADLFFMGAAFLLLETKYVTGFALFFGTTWVVNALVFAGVIACVLAAVEVTRRLPLPSARVLYGLLGAALLLAYVVPSSAVLSLPLVTRLLVAVALAFAPIFCANLVFAKRFAATSASTAAFGANLLGALLGGTLEYSALVVGYRALLILAALLYLAAFLLTPRASAAAS